MHAALVPLAHFVPVIAREFQLRSLGQLDLRQCHEIVEACLTGQFLREKPAHLLERCALGEPREKWIMLARTDTFQGLEPVHERVSLGRHRAQVTRDRLAFRFHERALDATYRDLPRELSLEINVGQRRR